MFMLVVLAGIMALTLDFGFVLQSRRLMQTGVNTAALEGLRNLDSDNDNVGDGRQNAAALLRNVFDDNLDPTANNTTVGAGIDSSLVQGDGFRQTILGSGSGSQSLYENRSDFIYRPIPQLNTLNLPNGDMVEGEYIDNATSHQEFSDYQRDDFSVGVPGDPSSAFFKSIATNTRSGWRGPNRGGKFRQRRVTVVDGATWLVFSETRRLKLFDSS